VLQSRAEPGRCSHDQVRRHVSSACLSPRVLLSAEIESDHLAPLAERR
jgi:hypothetical protein